MWITWHLVPRYISVNRSFSPEMTPSSRQRPQQDAGTELRVGLSGERERVCVCVCVWERERERERERAKRSQMSAVYQIVPLLRWKTLGQRRPKKGDTKFSPVPLCVGVHWTSMRRAGHVVETWKCWKDRAELKSEKKKWSQICKKKKKNRTSQSQYSFSGEKAYLFSWVVYYC